MPYQDGKYVAPTWSNNAPPPINASELQAIADKCEDTWDKDETISSDTAAIYGLGTGYTPDQAFRAISTNFNRTINVTVTLDGSPIEGVTVTGITTEDGGPCVTNSEGKTSGVTGVDTVTIKTSSGFVDVNEASQVVNTGGSLETNASLAITSQSSGSVQITTSQSIKFNPNRTSVTYFIVGGGAGGNALRALYNNSAVCVIAGAAGGYTKTGTINPSNTPVTITIGAGGKGATVNTNRGTVFSGHGSVGGNTIISGSFGTVTANGGGYASEAFNFEPLRDYFVLPGGNGGSGGGSVMNYSSLSEYSTTTYIGNGGSNGSNGGIDGSNTETPYGDDSSSTGQGTSTTFNGVVYSPAGSAMAYGAYINGAQNQSVIQGTVANGAGANLVTTTSATGNTATIPGGAGGWIYNYAYGEYTLTAGSGANGIAIFSW